MARVTAFAIVLVLGSQAASAKGGIPPQFWGVWGVSVAECADDDGPNFNTVIAPDGVEQYENHCRLKSTKAQGDAVLASLSCEAEGERSSSVMKLAMTPQDTLVLTVRGGNVKGERVLALQRCAAKRPSRR